MLLVNASVVCFMNNFTVNIKGQLSSCCYSLTEKIEILKKVYTKTQTNEKKKTEKSSINAISTFQVT
jgi:hypothetical protein